ncbi:malate transporter [Escherichia coli]|nr:malate transporter [Escherichia coli]
MTYKYNPFWQQRIRETVRHALNVHPRLTALRVDLRFPDVPAATDAAVISRFINALKARIDAYQKRKHREGKRVHPTTLHYVWAREFGECKGKKHYHLMLLVKRYCPAMELIRQSILIPVTGPPLKQPPASVTPDL